MAGILSAAAQRINASVAGQTQIAGAAENEGAKAQSISPTEALGAIPTEFGGLNHLFGGEGSPAQYTPVETARSVPLAQRGPNGGLVPDFRNLALKTEESVHPPHIDVPTTLTPISTAAKNTVRTIRQRLGL